MTTSAAPAWFTALLESLRTGDVDAYVAAYADDAVHEFPVAREGRLQRLEGKAAIAEYMQRLPGAVEFDAVDIIAVREVGDELIVEAEGHGRRPATGQPFEAQYVLFITRKDGLISRFRDYTYVREG